MGCCCALTDRGVGKTHFEFLPRTVELLGSVGKGGKNISDDVFNVQRLLNNANAVAGVPGKPIAIDGLVGPETIGAITQFQSKMLGFADGRVDPANKTITKLNSLVPENGATKSATTEEIYSSNKALEMVPLATLWAFSGLMNLFGLFSRTQFGGGTPGTGPEFSIANTHFHFDRDLPNLRSNLLFTIGVFSRTLQTLAISKKIFADGPLNPKSPFADAPMGGFHFPNTIHHFITFRPRYKTLGPLTRTAMILHESAHFVGGTNEIGHFAMEFPFPQGQPQGDGNTRNYAQLLTHEAIRNASSYAAFAIHAHHNVDHRFGAADLTQ